MSDNQITIGRLSNSTGVNIETIRYYEKIGILPIPHRSAGGHRLYNRFESDRLKFIRRCRKLGFSLDEVRTLLRVGDDQFSCDTVKKITENQIKSIRTRIRDLRKLEKRLVELADQCNTNDNTSCPMINALYQS
ncbi:MerR family transcriptional regulator [Hyphococcus lacteus]|uniref:Helix-turn-helix domain-containing protein n=1 Tax=Hyphococcus lacteus TaxID=3143536 RepID=A0ABV3Z6H1_9PROT